MTTTHHSGERRASAACHLLVPVWVIPPLLLGWAYLVAGTGGQDMGSLSWIAAIASAIAPLSLETGPRWGWMALYLSALLVEYGLVCVLFLGGPPTLKAHARRALFYGIILVPAVLATPYVLGVVAGLPADRLSVMDGTRVIDTNPIGIAARRAAAFAFPGLLLALPMVVRWQADLRRAALGRPPEALGRRFWVAEAVFVVLSALIVLGGIFSPV